MPVTRVVALGVPCLQARLAKNLLQNAGRGWVIGHPDLFGKTPPKHAAEPRDCPCRPLAPKGLGLGLGLGLGSGWSGPT